MGNGLVDIGCSFGGRRDMYRVCVEMRGITVRGVVRMLEGFARATCCVVSLGW